MTHIDNDALQLASKDLASQITGTADGFLKTLADHRGLDESATQTVLAKAWIQVAAEATARAASMRAFRTEDPQAFIDGVVGSVMAEANT